MMSLTKTESGPYFFPEKGTYRWLLLFLIFLAGLAVRLNDINIPPMDFHPIRQYRSFKLARALYYESSDSIPQSDKIIAEAAKPFQLEPPILDYMTAFLYHIFGGENMVIPQMLSILFWLCAAVLILKLAEDLISPDAGIIAVAFFLFLPFGVRASRSFQPDPLMIMMFVASIYAIYKYYSNSSNRLLALACVLSGLAVFVKPVCIFPILGAFMALRIATMDIRSVFFRRDVFIFAAAIIAPAVLYYCYAIFIAGFLKSQADQSFVPSYYLTYRYWRDWYHLVNAVMGRWSVALSILGVLLLRSKVQRAFLVGLWAGYVVFGLFFTHHISTHDYYSLMLVPIGALSLGGLGSFLLQEFKWSKGILRFAVWCVFVVPILFTIRDATWPVNDADFQKTIKMSEEIGDHVNHSTNTIFLDKYYGDVLLYYGKFAGRFWPNRDDWEFADRSHIERGKTLLDHYIAIAKKAPEYFIVSSMEELVDQQDLKEVLDERYVVVAATPDYIIYDMKQSKTPAGGNGDR